MHNQNERKWKIKVFRFFHWFLQFSPFFECGFLNFFFFFLFLSFPFLFLLLTFAFCFFLFPSPTNLIVKMLASLPQGYPQPKKRSLVVENDDDHCHRKRKRQMSIECSFPPSFKRQMVTPTPLFTSYSPIDNNDNADLKHGRDK